MTYEFSPSFDRTFQDQPADSQKRIRRAIQMLMEYFEGGPLPHGLGLKKLQKNTFEIRAGLQERVILAAHGDRCRFLLVGSHDDIRRFLAHL